MKNIFKFSMLLMVLLFAFSSCEKENIDEREVITETPDPTIEHENNLLQNLVARGSGSLELGCIEIHYPFELLLSDESTATVASDEDFENLLFDTMNMIYVVDFVYPLDVTDDEGEEVTVNDAEELGMLFVSCIPEEGWSEDHFPAFDINFENSCYELVYPINLEDLDGEILTANDEAELIDIIASNEIVFFVFPFSLVDEDGNVTEVNDADELFFALSLCEEFSNPCDTTFTGGGGIACYEIQFPANLILIDGTVVTVEDQDEFFNYLFNGEIENFEYPLTLIDPEGNIVIVNSDEELEEALEACYDIVFPPMGGDLQILFIGSLEDCYDINYPVTTVNVSGEAIEINNDGELEEAAFDETDPQILNYPVTVTLNTGAGGEVVLEDVEDLFELLELCN